MAVHIIQFETPFDLLFANCRHCTLND